MRSCNYLKPTRNRGALFFRPKTVSKWPKTTKNRQNTPFWRYFALFLAQKSARRVDTPRAHLQLPQSTSREPQEPRRTFFPTKTSSKWPKTTKNRPNTPFFETFCPIFSAKKCAEVALALCPLATTSIHPQKASGTAAHFLGGRKRPQNGQNDPQQM